MPTGGVRTKNRQSEPAGQLAWDWFDRELADINAALARIEAATQPISAKPAAQSPRTEPAREAKAAPAQPRGLAAAAPRETPSPAAPVAPSGSPAAAAAPAAVPALPTGTDLADPKNFGLMPPTENLEPGTASPEDYRKRLARDLAFATKVLHTSRVPAAVWREWRGFEKAVQERLRTLTVQPAAAE